MNKKSYILLYFIFLVMLGSIGFYLLGENNWSWVDSIYMTVITLSTVGYGEIHPLTEAGKIWAVLVIIFGVTGIGILLRTFREEFIQIEQYRVKKMMKKISKLKNHFVICGYGRMGAVIAGEFQEKGLDFVIIEVKDKKVDKIRSKGMFCVHGDATSDETYTAASVENAAGVAIVLPTDQDNLFVTMSMKTTNPDLFIVSRCSLEYNNTKLIRAGANRVINPYITGGHRMAEILSKPQVEDSISVLSPKHMDMHLTLDEISLENLIQYNDVSLIDSNIQKDYDIMVVGIINSSGETNISPKPETILNMTDTLLLMGDVDKMDIFKDNLPS